MPNIIEKNKQSVSINWSGHNQLLAMIKHNQSLAMIKHVNETNQKSLGTVTHLIR